MGLELVNRAAEPGEYDEVVDKLVADIAVKPPQILKMQKRMRRRFRFVGLERGTEASISDIDRTFGTDEQREAISAFMEGRPPSFDG